MESVNQGSGKRPICRSCSKPLRLCLCDRFKHPPINNAIALTILRHSHEKNHPLNSTRIVTLGLKNINVVTVSDVHFQAQFVIRSLLADLCTDTPVTNTKCCFGPSSEICRERVEPHCCGTCESEKSKKETGISASKSSGTCNLFGIRLGSKSVLMEDTANLACGRPKESSGCFSKKLMNPNSELNVVSFVAQNGLSEVDCGRSRSVESENSFSRCLVNVGFSSTCDGRLDEEQTIESAGRENSTENSSRGTNHNSGASKDTRAVPSMNRKHFCKNEDNGGNSLPDILQTDLPTDNPSISNEDLITATIAKCGFTCTLSRLWNGQKHTEEPDLIRLSASPLGKHVISDGFIVKKLQRKQVDDKDEIQEFEEFEITIPPGSALLFPSEKSVSLENIEFNVKHLIVLDGTWAKAKRMYHENPWLKLLPHLKLDSKEVSLYSEVRHQPKAGCLSTIESIVCALKGLGEDSKGLDDLLDVFKSMVGDQRRCKDEKLKKETTA
ncbi:uncharacterized protein [Aristolochia californica]|uniref:uncharacterized protein n=1 Tax=Aristolochia californica TaxID=171875 RepID=UPI0035E205B9